MKACKLCCLFIFTECFPLGRRTVVLPDIGGLQRLSSFCHFMTYFRRSYVNISGMSSSVAAEHLFQLVWRVSYSYLALNVAKNRKTQFYNPTNHQKQTLRDLSNRLRFT